MAEGEEGGGALGSYYGSRALRRLVLASKDDAAARRFVDALWVGALKGRCVALHKTHAAKVLAAVVHGGSSVAAKGTRAELKKAVGKVDEWAATFVQEKAKK